MCFSLVLSIVGTVATVAGAVQAANAAKDRAEGQALIAQQNQEIAERNAERIRELSEERVAERGKRTRQVVGAARAAIAANGMILDEDGTTPDALIEDLYDAGAMDVLRIKDNFANEELRALTQGAQYELQAGLYASQASSISPGLAGFTALAGAAPDLIDAFS